MKLIITSLFLLSSLSSFACMKVTCDITNRSGSDNSVSIGVKPTDDGLC